MAAPRSTLTVDGTKINAVCCSVMIGTQKDRDGIPAMGTLNTTIRAWVDFHDEQAVPNSTLKKLFELANSVDRDKIKEMKIEFWKDDKMQDALCSYKFKGWISRFETTNAPVFTDSDTSFSGINHLLVLDLEPALNQQHHKELSLGN